MSDGEIKRQPPPSFKSFRDAWLWALGHQEGDDAQHTSLNKALNNIERLLTLIAIGVIGSLVMTILGIMIRADHL